MDRYSLFLDEDYRLIGTTEQEFFYGKAAAVRFLKATADQLAGNLERRNSRHKIEIIDNLVFITDQFDAYVLIDDKWSFYEKTRVTTLLHEKKDGWKIIQQHFSFPDNKAGSGQTIGLEKITKENLQLKEAIRRRTIELELKNKELEIEFSLERVRAVAMGMKQPADMLEVCEVIARELISLGVGPIRNIQTAVIDTEKETYQNYEYYQVAREKLVTTVSYKEHPIIHAFVKRMVKDPEGFYARRMKGEGLKKWIKYQAKAGQFVDPTSKKAASLHYYFYSIGSGALGITSYAPLSKEAIGLFKRFRNVFQLAYARFVDIQQAEEQAREAQVQLAMERVRARTMAMQSSEELPVAANLLFHQVQSLGMPAWSAGYCIWDDNKQGVTLWMSSEGVMQPAFHAPLTKDPSFIHMREAFEQGQGFHVEEVGGKALVTHYKYMRTLPVVGEVLDSIIAAGHPLPVFQIFHCVYFSHGFLLFITYEPVPEAHFIFKRFGTVFDQTYTRFLDLQKAEAQAREAQIEAALERVRSRSMAMHKSDELKEVIRVVLAQFIHLNIKAEHAGFYIDYKAQEDMHIWLADPNLEPFFAVIPYFDTPTWNSFLEAKTKGIDLHTDLLDFKTKNKFYKSLFKLFKVPEEAKQFYLKCKGLAVSTVLLDNVGLYIENFSAIPYTDQENEILMRFGKVFQQTYTRFLDLQKAEAQAREAQIEVALERVRSRSMAMHKSEELADLSLELVKQVQALGVATWFCAFNIYDDDEKGSVEWGSNGQGTFPAYRTPREGVFLRYYQAGQKEETLLINEIGEAECPAHYEYLCTLPGLGEQLLSMKNAGIAFPVSQIDHVAFFKYGYIIFITYKAVPESHDIFVRFARIFEQTYTRFLDLRRAEAQAREGQIEAAVERVRAQSMAMHKASDLVRVNEELLLQLSRLHITGLTGVSFYLVDEAGIVKVWDLSSPGNMSNANNYAFSYDPEKYPILGEFVGIWKAAELDYFILDFPKDKLLKAVEELQHIAPDAAGHFRNAIESGALTHQWNPAGRLTNGILSIDLMQAPSADTKNIVLKMAGAFNLAYQRFLDLQKAEAQTREAQIEAALEKVRSRTMAMQSSNELQETAAVLFQEFKKLGTDDMYQVTIGIYNEAAQLIDFRVTSWADNGAQENRSFQLDMNEPTLLLPAVTAWRANKKSVVIDLTGEALEGWLNYRNRMSGITVRSQDTEGRRVISAAFFSKGHISISSPVPVTVETLRTLERFAAVFDGTYTRFLDLEKAEAQIREVQIEAALERVRSRTLAMQKSEELVETAAVLFQQLIGLGIEPNRLYISIINSEQGETEFWITDEEGRKVSTAFTAKMQDNATFLKMYEGWKQQQKSLVIDMQGEELQNYFRHLTGLGVSFKGGLKQKRRIQEIAYFSKGFIGMASPEEQPAETLELLERFAAVFNLTFTRFNDLKMAEAHARQSELDLIAIKEAKLKAEEALSVLQATQKQLVQAEKMASLGELTAGIAHEIQNPLNFVNNFSEVSNELISEMVDEVDKGNTEEVKAIARDVQQNLEKILHHGKRADGIVKGMLQHSRSSSGVKEPTDINALADEYLRLAYHGLRAKDKSFNASLKTEFDDTIGNIPVIPQDIGRVILNLITNAFYAAPLPPKGGFSDPDYRHVPTVWVSTKRERDKVIISVRDNGPGIPAEIRDKIFQPFFTTKPTGQGTGLGLSLSYDIVKAHGGELKVVTKEGEGSEFFIVLPI